MNSLLQELVDLLDMERIDTNLFRGRSQDIGSRSVFGGQVLGQALLAAGRTVEGADAHSLHGYFLRPGDLNSPIIYEVERMRDGGHFAARRVHAIQFGRPILSMIASFQKPEEGFSHQAAMPEVPPPEALRNTQELMKLWRAERSATELLFAKEFSVHQALEFRPCDPRNPLSPDVRPPFQSIWWRATDRLPDDPLLHRCILAYASDFHFVGTAMQPHGLSYLRRDYAIASIDHALWVHRDFRVDDWLLYVMDSPNAGGARGFARGQIFDRSGRLIASCAQEGLMRHLSDVSQWRRVIEK